VRGQDTVFHLAALIGIPHSYVAPRSCLRMDRSQTAFQKSGHNLMLPLQHKTAGQLVGVKALRSYASGPLASLDACPQHFGEKMHAAAQGVSFPASP